MKKLFPICLLLLLSYQPFCHSSSIDNGQEIANETTGSVPACAVCHQTDGSGNAAAAFPRVAGLNEAYMVSQLNAFIDGSRVSPVMQASLQGLKPQQLLDVSAYYANLPIPDVSRPEVSDSNLELGRQLAENGDWSKYIPACQKCHGPGHQGVGDTFPALAGQHASYIKQQLLAWQQNQRQNDPNQLMIFIAKRMDSDDINAVAAYLASLSPQKR